MHDLFLQPLKTKRLTFSVKKYRKTRPLASPAKSYRMARADERLYLKSRFINSDFISFRQRTSRPRPQ
jgi:hypothetical protein